jgi:DNA adenine methylase
VDYFNSWTEHDERRLYESLSQTKAKFILSTWHSNKYRKNPLLHTLWSRFYAVTKKHFYHVGARESNRNAIIEALVMNFPPVCSEVKKSAVKQAILF